MLLKAEIPRRDSRFLGLPCSSLDYYRVVFSDGLWMELDRQEDEIRLHHADDSIAATGWIHNIDAWNFTNFRGKVRHGDEVLRIRGGFFGFGKFTHSTHGKLTTDWIHCDLANDRNDPIAEFDPSADPRLSDYFVRLIVACSLARAVRFAHMDST